MSDSWLKLSSLWNPLKAMKIRFALQKEDYLPYTPLLPKNGLTCIFQTKAACSTTVGCELECALKCEAPGQ